MPDVVVVGGGIIGAACAYELARAGASVTLVERDELAAGASGRNQGWLVTPDDPVNLPLYDAGWYLEAVDRSPLPVWIDADPVGYLLVALPGDESSEPEGSRSMRRLAAAEVRALEPAVTETAIGGWLADGGRRLDPASMTVGLALLASEAGAVIRHHLRVRAVAMQDDHVRGVVTDDGIIEADRVVVAAGPWTSTLLEPIGVRLPVRSARGWIVRLGPPLPRIRHLIERVGWRGSGWRAGAVDPVVAEAFAADGLRATGGPLLNPHPDGTVLVGSSREPAIAPEPADPTVPQWQVRDAIELMPVLAAAEVRSAWWGVRPMSPDDRPLIGPVGNGLIVATGHGSEGVILGAGTAKLVAAQVFGKPLPFDPSPFDPSRFASDA